MPVSMTMDSASSAPSDVAGAVAALAAGQLVVVVDTVNHLGALIAAADRVTPRTMSFVVRYTSGFVYVALPDARADRLGLPALAEVNRNSDSDPERTGLCVSADAAHDITTGISARDRAHTAAILADPSSSADDLTRPGHTLPIRVAEGGLLDRVRFAEAAVDLCRWSDAEPVAVVATVVSEDDARMMAPEEEVRRFAYVHRLPVLDLHELAGYRRQVDAAPSERRSSWVSLAAGEFVRTWYRFADGGEFLALRGSGAQDAPVSHVHHECVDGDVLGSTECDCGTRLQQQLAETARTGGTVIYVREGLAGSGLGCPLERSAELSVQAQRALDFIRADLGLT